MTEQGGDAVERSTMLSELDTLERFIDAKIAPFLELWPAPRPTSVGIAIGRLMAFRSEVRQFRAKERETLMHRRRICSVLADLLILVEAIKPEAEKILRTTLPQSALLMMQAFAVKQAVHSPTWPVELSRDEHGFIRPLTATEAKRQRKAEKRKRQTRRS